jgi:hypothetical protein
MFDRVFSTRSRAETAILPYSFSGEVKHVGRIKEINNIINLSEKKVNTVILGQQGIGKSHILKKLKLEKHLWFDDLDSMKKSVADAILMLCHGVKEKVAELLNITEKNVVTKFSIPQLVNALISLTEKLEYTIIVDDATNMTPSALRIMAKLKSHFHMIVACRYIELKNMEAFTGFEKVEIIPFTQAETFAMIEKNCLDFKSRIKDYAAFRMHVWTETDGIPEFILDKLERYRKERVIRVEQFNTIGYNTNNEFSVTPIVFLMVGSLVVYKFYIREQSPIDKNGGMLIGAAAMVFLMFGRLIFGQFKQKYI